MQMQRHFLSALCAGLLFLTSPLLKADVITVGSTIASVGSSFDVPITISGASDLYAFQFDLSFDPSILQLTSIIEGSFLLSSGPTFFISGTIDNTLGIATFTADTIVGAIAGAAGTGTLATFDFQAVMGGVSAMGLSNVILLDSNLNDIPFTAQSGQTSVVSTVSEPGSIWLLAYGVSLLLFLRNRQNREVGAF